MFAQLKAYLLAAAGIAIAVFAAVFKYRGMKIDKLEHEVKEHEAKDKAQDFVADNREAAARAEAKDHEVITDGTYTF